MLCSLIKKLWKPVVYTGIGLRLLFSDPLYGQTANISSSINNQLGNRANNINIKLEQVENRSTFYNTVSDNNGNYSFSNVVVPVELMSFNAKYNTKDNNIKLEWATASAFEEHVPECPAEPQLQLNIVH